MIVLKYVIKRDICDLFVVACNSCKYILFEEVDLILKQSLNQNNIFYTHPILTAVGLIMRNRVIIKLQRDKKIYKNVPFEIKTSTLHKNVALYKITFVDKIRKQGIIYGE